MKAAYRQVPVHPETSRFSVVAVYCPAMQAWRYGLLDGLAFGLTSAVLHFNRLPAFVEALPRRRLAIPVTNFFDDFKVTEPAECQGSADASFLALTRALGVVIDPEKRQLPGRTCTFLGASEDSS